ncbi:MAG: ribokinase [Candidatus Schekmanbacteria bacterium]|nr:MAG: ribokinase [Candidatus Schekmanbacteria bacterium]
MKNSLVVVGSANVDFSAKCERLPSKGETVLASSLEISFGGKGANQALAALKGGADVFFITKVGCDEWGRRYRDYLKSKGISENGILRDKREHTGIALITVDEKGENIISVYPGANSLLCPNDVLRGEVFFKKSSVLLLQLEIPMETVDKSLSLAKENRLLTILNPAPSRRLANSLLKKVDLLTPNRKEAEEISGIKIGSKRDALKSAEILMKKGVKSVVITLGREGAIFHSINKTLSFKPPTVNAIDSTGAGDAFNGALAAYISRGEDIENACRMAVAAGTFSVGRRGIHNSYGTERQIKKINRLVEVREIKCN